MMMPFFLVLLEICTKYILITSCIELDCHKENTFVKTNQESLPEVNAIETITSINAALCVTQCLDVSGCKSIVFLVEKSENNCLLSREINGAKVSTENSITYIKTSQVTKLCLTNVCAHGSTCTDVCTSPYYHCNCLPTYFKGKQCEINSKCDILKPCQNSGTCSPSANFPYYTCSCPTYFAGTNCEVNTRCNANPCWNGGNCYTKSESPYYYCSCRWPFDGYYCSRNSRCDHNPCHNGGGCYTKSHSPYFGCSCTFGHWGDYCEKHVFNPFG